MSRSDSLREAIIDRVAAQWIALGGQLVGDPDETVIDIEALVAVTSDVADAEPRVAANHRAGRTYRSCSVSELLSPVVSPMNT